MTKVSNDSDKNPIKEKKEHKNWTEVHSSFEEMDLEDNILRGIYSFGFERPSGIQQRSIVPIIKCHDIVAQAQSGTGKTGAFSIGVLQRINPNLNAVQCLILAPTRELVQQIHCVISSISKYMNISVNCFIGGTQVNEDIKVLNEGTHLAIGTPGRVYDLMERDHFNTSHMKAFVIDEADQMLATDFKGQIHRIFTKIPEDTQVCLFSATLPPDVMEITHHFMKDAYQILVKAKELTLEGIKQFYVDVDREDWKFDTLCDIYQNISITQAIIYVNSQKKCDYIHDKLISNHFAVSRIHGKMSQQERNSIMIDFRSGSTRILLTTDLLARGIDIQQVSLVINYDIPIDKESYLHRIGRTGRFGRKGVAINLVTKEDYIKMKELEKYYETILLELPSDLSNIFS